MDLLLRSGLDETAVNSSGKTPAALTLEAGTGSTRAPLCSPEEVERAKLLLDRAPNDGAWHRRCWLVMLGSRASRAKIGCDTGDSSSGRGSTAIGDVRGESGTSKALSTRDTKVVEVQVHC